VSANDDDAGAENALACRMADPTDTLQRLSEKAAAGVALPLWADGEPAALAAKLRPALRAVGDGRATLPQALSDILQLSTMEMRLVQAGLDSGRLASALDALVQARRARRAGQRKMALALLYPALLLGVASTVLPLPLWVARGFSSYASVAGVGLAVLASLVALVVVWPRLSVDHVVKRAVSRLPGLHTLHTLQAWSVFCQTFAAFLSSGVAPAVSLPLALDATAHPDLVGRGEGLLLQLDRGATLTQALEQLPHVDDQVLQAVAHAEHTGMLDEAFAQQGRRLQAQASRLQLMVVAAVAGFAAICVVVTIVIALVQGVQGYFDLLNDLADGT